jgi:predicted ATPase with chaperone activity
LEGVFVEVEVDIGDDRSGFMVVGLTDLAVAREKHVRAVFVPAADAMEAALVQGVTIYPVETLGHLLAHLNGERQIEPYIADPRILDNCGIPQLVSLVTSIVSLLTLFPLHFGAVFQKPCGILC